MSGIKFLGSLSLGKKPGLAKSAPPKKKNAFFGGGEESDDEAPSKQQQATTSNVQTITELDDDDFASVPTRGTTKPSSSRKTKHTVPKEPPKLKRKAEPSATLGDLSNALVSRKNQEAAEKLDANIYDYDAVYDSLKPPPKTKSAQEDEEDAQPRYMTGIVAAAAVRKRDAMAAEQVKVDREREAEGDDFADKEVFVTAAYKKQQEDKKKMDAELAQIEEAEAEKRKGGGGMTDFYKKILKEKEEEHNSIMRAAELRSKMTPEERAREDKLREEYREKTDEERAREINAKGGKIAINDDGQIVDKRQMLHGGLNVLSTRKKEASTEVKPRQRAPELDRKAGVFGPGGRQAQRERQSKMIEEQLAESLKRAREEEEQERQKIEAMTKSRKTSSDVSSAKERYLARKRAAEEAKNKDKDIKT
ncbi:hypothetical protein BROUX41_002442 [Berkeleyomyces rouxiae]|uniref:uncharacterized protein n=1 Tax=Berkeleyomyces rouxiae TaxID=2035830 RepID=UPI003B7F5BF9